MGKSERLSAKVVVLKELIDYQEASIVSRALVDKKKGTVTLFAFDENQGLSEHTAPYDALIFIVEGETEVAIQNKPYRLKEGELIIIPANKPHTLKAISKFKMLLIMIRA